MTATGPPATGSLCVTGRVNCGKGDPTNILAYLQFLSERRIDECATLPNRGAAEMLEKFYGYRFLRPVVHKDRQHCQGVDIYIMRERRCGNTIYNLIGRVLYWRPGILKALRGAVEY